MKEGKVEIRTKGSTLKNNKVLTGSGKIYCDKIAERGGSGFFTIKENKFGVYTFHVHTEYSLLDGPIR